MKYFSIIAMVFLISCHNNNAKNTVSNKKSTNSEKNIILYPPIPVELQECINEKLPDFKYLKRYGILSELEENTAFVSADYPFFTKGDFNGDNETDYVLILLGNDDKLKIVVFTSSSDSFKIDFIDDYLLQYYDVYDNQVLLCLEYNIKGEYETAYGTVNIKNDYFSISFIEESRTKSYEWNNGEYQDVYFD